MDTLKLIRARRLKHNRELPEQLCLPGMEHPTEAELKRREKKELSRKRYAILVELNIHARRLAHENESRRRGLDIGGAVCSAWVRESAGIIKAEYPNVNNYLGCLFTVAIPGKPKWAPITDRYASKFSGSHNRKITLWKQSTECWPE